MKFVLRDYQKGGVNACVEILNSEKPCKQLVVAPTGAGKSIYISKATELVEGAILVLQPSAVLLKQNYTKFVKSGGKATICCASLTEKRIKGEPYTKIDGEYVKCREVSRVTFATVGTVKAFIEDLKELNVKKIILDEAHLMTRSTSSTVYIRGMARKKEKPSQIKKLIKALGVKNVCGVTATPIFLVPGMLGSELRMMNRVQYKMFTDIKHVTQISELTTNNFWTPLKYTLIDIDKTSLRHNTTGSDFTLDSLKRFSQENGIKDLIIENINRLIEEGRKSILVFVSTIEEADELHNIYKKSVVVHSKLSDKDKIKVLEYFQSGKVKVGINVNMWSTGFDHPRLDAIITARPTSSVGLFYQQLGRGVRLHEDKKDCEVVDLSGNVEKFGKVEELTIEEIPYYGWGMFNGKNELLTNFPLKTEYRPTKKSLMDAGKRKLEKDKKGAKKKNNYSNPKFNFGKFKGKRLWDIAKTNQVNELKSYCNWIYGKYKNKEFHFYGEQGRAIKCAIIEFLQLPDNCNENLPF